MRVPQELKQKHDQTPESCMFFSPCKGGSLQISQETRKRVPSIWWAGGVTSPQKLFCFIFPFSGVPPTARCAGDVPGSGQAGHPGAVHRPSMAREVLRPLPVGLRAGAGGGGGGAKSSSYGFRVGRRKRAATRGAWQVKDLLIPVGGMCSVVIQPRRTIRLVWLDGRFQVKADPA